MAATYWFRLPGDQIAVAPALHLSDAVGRRQFVLLFDLPDDPGQMLDDPSLSWSRSFNCSYRYAPASGEGGVLRTPSFAIPAGVRRLRIRVQPRPSDAPGEIDDVTLHTELHDRPVVVLAEAS